MFIRPGFWPGSGRKPRSPSSTASPGQADGDAGGRRGQRVGHVEGGQAGQGDGHVQDRQQPVDPAPGQHDQVAVEHGGGPAALGLGLAQAGRVRVEAEGERPGPRQPAHGQGAGVVGVEHDPAAGAGDPHDRRLDLGQLVEGLDAAEAEVVGGDVGDHGDVVVGHPDPAAQDPAPGRLQHGQLDAGLGQDLGRPARARPVALLHQLAVQVDAVGVGPADVQPGAAAHVGDQPGHRRLAVGPGHGHRRHPGHGQRRARAGLDLAQGRPALPHPLGQAGLADRGDQLGHGLAQGLGGVLAPPRVGGHQLGRLGAGAAAHGQGPHPGRGRGPPDQVGQQPGGEAPPLLAPGRSRRPGRQADLAGRRRRPLLGQREQAGHVQGELDRRAREVQVGPVEHPQLDQGWPRGLDHGQDIIR